VTDAPNGSDDVDEIGTADESRTTVLKLGGSVVTDKAKPETVDEASLGRAADAIAAHVGADGSPRAADAADAGDTANAATENVSAIDGGAGLVLVHGGGSFGHYHANEHDVSTTAGTHDAAAARAIHDAMGRLDDRVLDAFHGRDVPALPVDPLSGGARDEAGELTLSTTAVSGMLGEGFVPVVQADVVAHAGSGATIVSGDELVTLLATRLGASRVGLCSTVPGVFDADGVVIDRIASLERAGEYLGASEATDVTGGMYGKIEQLFSLDVPASVFGLSSLEDFLAGEAPGTLVHRRSR
jgi:isopentenyl phosphate kinase